MAVLLGSAAVVVASWPRREGTRDLRPSPLLQPLVATEADLLLPEGLAPCWREAVALAAGPEVCADSGLVPMGAWERVNVSGGTGLFEDHAACPFKSFAVHRLQARRLGEPSGGFAADARGSLVHRALQLLWEGIGDGGHAALLALGEGQAEALAAQCARTAVDARRGAVSARFAALEEIRISRLLLDLLVLERGREPFSVVARERECEVTNGGLTIRIRVDRVDRLAKGGLLFLDYKTGNVTTCKDWHGERPLAPQLPLYSGAKIEQAEGEQVAGLAFVRIRAGAVGFVGYAERPDVAPGIEPCSVASSGKRKSLANTYGSWDQFLGSLRAELAAVGGSFLAGNALVDPKPGKGTMAVCPRCPMGIVCRIAERDAELLGLADETVLAGGGTA